MKKFKQTFLILGTLLFLMGAAAPPKFNSTLPIRIQSDSATYQHLLGEVIYQGNVIVTQGDYELKANTITIKKSDKGNVLSLLAEGKPAIFKSLLIKNQKPLSASADKIIYHPQNKLLVLENNASLHYQKDTFTGPRLSYDLEKQTIVAKRHQNIRPVFIIHPQAHHE